MPAPRRRFRAAAYLLYLALLWLLFEAAYGALYRFGYVEPPDDVWLFEDSGKTVHFDPVSGYIYTPLPSRAARLSHGSVEFVTTFRGNAQGFNDRDDFSPRRGRSAATRIAVLGDSFTSAEHLRYNWPQRVEQRTRERGGALRLYNFSVSGAGLANWWSIARRHIDARDYELDALLFAVFDGDLARNFSFADHRDSDRHRFARAADWDPASWPQTLAEARPLLQTLPGYIVDAARFDAALDGRWHPLLPRRWRLGRAGRTLARLLAPRPAPAPPAAPSFDGFDDGQRRLIDDLRRYLDERKLPALVVAVPGLDALLARRAAPADARRFAELLGARFADGATPFYGMSEAALRADWMPYDGHWAQRGSDRFAAFVDTLLRDWPGGDGKR